MFSTPRQCLYDRPSADQTPTGSKCYLPHRPIGDAPNYSVAFPGFCSVFTPKNLPRLKTGLGGNRFLDTGNENGSAYSQKRKWELRIAFQIFGNGIENPIPVFWERESDVANSLFPGINGNRKSMKIRYRI